MVLGTLVDLYLAPVSQGPMTLEGILQNVSLRGSIGGLIGLIGGVFWGVPAIAVANNVSLARAWGGLLFWNSILLSALGVLVIGFLTNQLR